MDASDQVSGARLAIVNVALGIREQMFEIAVQKSQRSEWIRLKREAAILERSAKHLTDALEDVGRAFRPLRRGVR
jgi:hypothetical protein